MRLNEVTYTDANPVEGYGPGFFRIGGTVHEGALITGPNGTGPWDGVTDAAPLMALAGQVAVIFVGGVGVFDIEIKIVGNDLFDGDAP